VGGCDVIVSDGFIFGNVEGRWGVGLFVAPGRPKVVAFGGLPLGVGVGACGRF
jgi:hypothetical protein